MEASLGPYRLLAPLSSGGVAQVFLARREGSNELVVVKRLRLEMQSNSKAGKRLVREAQITAQLRHPNIAQIRDAGFADACFYIVSELIQGQELLALLQALLDRQARMSHELAIGVGKRVLEALSYAHTLKDPEGRALNIVHRDLTPRNIMMTYDGQIKIIDFGLAKADLREPLTDPGTLLGTPRYMSPEQVRGEVVDHRTDLYSLSVMLYEMLTGIPLVAESRNVDNLLKVVEEVPPPLDFVVPDLPLGVGPAIDRGLVKSRDGRWPTADAYRSALMAAYRSDLNTTKLFRELTCTLFARQQAEFDALVRVHQKDVGLEAEQVTRTSLGFDPVVMKSLDDASGPRVLVSLPGTVRLDRRTFEGTVRRPMFVAGPEGVSSTLDTPNRAPELEPTVSPDGLPADTEPTVPSGDLPMDRETTAVTLGNQSDDLEPTVSPASSSVEDGEPTLPTSPEAAKPTRLLNIVPLYDRSAPSASLVPTGSLSKTLHSQPSMWLVAAISSGITAVLMSGGFWLFLRSSIESTRVESTETRGGVKDVFMPRPQVEMRPSVRPSETGPTRKPDVIRAKPRPVLRRRGRLSPPPSERSPSERSPSERSVPSPEEYLRRLDELSERLRSAPEGAIKQRGLQAVTKATMSMTLENLLEAERVVHQATR